MTLAPSLIEHPLGGKVVLGCWWQGWEEGRKGWCRGDKWAQKGCLRPVNKQNTLKCWFSMYLYFFHIFSKEWFTSLSFSVIMSFVNMKQGLNIHVGAQRPAPLCHFPRMDLGSGSLLLTSQRGAEKCFTVGILIAMNICLVERVGSGCCRR